MTFRLRDYQLDLIERTRASLRQHRRVFIQLPTGGGKTAIGAFMAGSAASKGLRVWFSVHRDFLLHQTSGAFDLENILHSFIAAKWPFNPHDRVQVCAIDTLRRRLDKLAQPDLIIIDEAHHSAARTWRAILEWCGRSRIIGLSATPTRLDGKGLDDLFDDIVCGPPVAWLIENGFLSDYRAFAPSTPDLTGVHTRAGDFAQDELEDVMDDGQIIGDMVRHYREKANGLRAIYFCVSIKHSKNVAATFTANGIPAAHLDGTSTTEERISAARAFADGSLRVLTNVDLFGEGYDLAAQAGRDVSIEAVGLARPTKSLALHLQQIGRSLRPKAERAVILDHAGNLMRHGLPDQEREWTLASIEKKKKDSSGVAAKQCPQCFAVHPPAPKCPYCGYEYPAGEGGREVDEIDGELKEVDVIAQRRSRKMEEWRCNTLGDLVELAKRRGYRNPEKWAGYIWTARESRAQKRVDAQAQAYLPFGERV